MRSRRLCPWALPLSFYLIPQCSGSPGSETVHVRVESVKQPGVTDIRIHSG